MSVFRDMQAAFIGGLLSSSMWQRVDLKKYNTGLKRAENMIIHAHGGISNRAGLVFVGETKGSQPARQITFDYDVDTDQSYNLVFTDQALRFFRHGSAILTGNPGDPDRAIYEVATPYTQDEIAALTVAQDKDVLYIAHRNHAPRKLERHGDNDWQLKILDFKIKMKPPTGIAAEREKGKEGHKDNVTYRYKVSAINKDTNEESLASAPVEVENDLTTAGYKNKITWDAHPDAKKYVVYKEDNGLYGLAGNASATSFFDENITADLSDAPQEEVNPFEGTGNYPGLVGFFEQRSVFASTKRNPSAFDLSQSANFENFGSASPAKQSDAIAFRIPSAKRNEIKAMAALPTGLVAFGSAGEWGIRGGSEDYLTPSNPYVRPQSYYGSGALPPLVVGEEVLFSQARGAVIRSFPFMLRMSDYDTTISNANKADLTIMARDLFRGKQIKSWDYARAPHSIVLVVFTDGSCAVLTYMKEHEVWGWTEFETDGQFEDVNVVPEDDEDVPYFVVRREIGGQTRRYIEKLHSRAFAQSKECFFVDSGLTYQGVLVSELIGLDHLEGKAVVALADGDVVSNLTVKGGKITLPHPAATVHAGLPYVSTLQTLDIDLGMVQGLGTVQGRKKTIGRMTLRLEKSRGLWAGPDEDNLEEWIQLRSDWTAPLSLYTGDVELTPRAEWSTHGNMIVQQRDPLPMTVLSIMPEVVIGG